jgi:hypothetical protein
VLAPRLPALPVAAGEFHSQVEVSERVSFTLKMIHWIELRELFLRDRKVGSSGGYLPQYVVNQERNMRIGVDTERDSPTGLHTVEPKSM